MDIRKTEAELVNDFGDKMFEKILLRRDRYSPQGWGTLDIKRLIWLLEGELSEIKSIISEPSDQGNALTNQITQRNNIDRIKDNAIDIANYAMFIHEITK